MLIGLIPVVISALAISAQAAAPGPRGSSGLQFVLRVEMRATAKAGARAPDMRSALPSGSAEVEYVTDGKAVRSTLHGEMAQTPDGTVTLALPGETVRYVLNPKHHTVETRPTFSARPEPGTFDSSVSSTGVLDTVEGHRVRKYLVSFRLFAARSDRSPRTRTDAAVQSVEIQAWCSAEFAVPPALTSMTNGVLSFLGAEDAKRFARSCPLALRTVMRMSSNPGFETVATVSSIRRVSPNPELFRVPGDYRKTR